MRHASCNAELRMMGDLPPWLLALTGYGLVAPQHRKASRAHSFAISPHGREFWLVNLRP
jgi:hypothetical protein